MAAGDVEHQFVECPAVSGEQQSGAPPELRQARNGPGVSLPARRLVLPARSSVRSPVPPFTDVRIRDRSGMWSSMWKGGTVPVTGTQAYRVSRAIARTISDNRTGRTRDFPLSSSLRERELAQSIRHRRSLDVRDPGIYDKKWGESHVRDFLLCEMDAIARVHDTQAARIC